MIATSTDELKKKRGIIFQNTVKRLKTEKLRRFRQKKLFKRHG